jgi:spoIIIJ-associated protein
VSGKSEFTGKTVDAAIEEAERTFGKSRTELQIHVLSQGSRGVFGLGGEPARISAADPTEPAEPQPTLVQTRVEPEVDAEDVVQSEILLAEAEAMDLEFGREPPTASPAGSRPRRVRSEHSADEREDFGEEGPAVAPEIISAAARDILQTLLQKMGFEVEVSIRPETEPVTLDVEGENLGILIGRRGDSLASLQFMVNVILSKQFRTWPRVVIDVQGYRSRREQSLTILGQRVADRVKRNHRPFTLEAMPANDRRVIHMTLSERTDVETYSIGEGQSRRVVIAPKR